MTKCTKLLTMVELQLQYPRRLRDTTVHDMVEVVVKVLGNKLCKQSGSPRCLFRRLEDYSISCSNRADLTKISDGHCEFGDNKRLPVGI